MTKEEFIEKIKELGFKNVEMVIEPYDRDNVYFKEYNDKLKLTCKCYYNTGSLYFDKENRNYMYSLDKAYEFIYFLIKKIENGFNNN